MYLEGSVQYRMHMLGTVSTVWCSTVQYVHRYEEGSVQYSTWKKGGGTKGSLATVFPSKRELRKPKTPRRVAATTKPDCNARNRSSKHTTGE